MLGWDFKRDDVVSVFLFEYATLRDMFVVVLVC